MCLFYDLNSFFVDNKVSMNVSVLLDGEESSLEFWDACMDEVKCYVPSPTPFLLLTIIYTSMNREDLQVTT